MVHACMQVLRLGGCMSGVTAAGVRALAVDGVTVRLGGATACTSANGSVCAAPFVPGYLEAGTRSHSPKVGGSSMTDGLRSPRDMEWWVPPLQKLQLLRLEGGMHEVTAGQCAQIVVAAAAKGLGVDVVAEHAQGPGAW